MLCVEARELVFSLYVSNLQVHTSTFKVVYLFISVENTSANTIGI